MRPVDQDVYVCPRCHEYKGIMTIAAYEDAYGPLEDDSNYTRLTTVPANDPWYRSTN